MSQNHGVTNLVITKRRGNLEESIRDLIIQLKRDRESVGSTVMDLENDWNMEPESGGGRTPHNKDAPLLSPCQLIEARKLDLETAVLMQELMGMREERAELRATLFHGDKERAGLEMELKSYQTKEIAYKARINYLTSELLELEQEKEERTQVGTQNAHTPEDTDGLRTIHRDGNANDTQPSPNKELVLKNKIQELITTLEKVTEASNQRERQSSEMMNELKAANGMLIQSLESLNRKYQSRIRKMEEQIMTIMERHTTTIKLYKEKIHFLEMEQRHGN